MNTETLKRQAQGKQFLPHRLMVGCLTLNQEIQVRVLLGHPLMNKQVTKKELDTMIDMVIETKPLLEQIEVIRQKKAEEKELSKQRDDQKVQMIKSAELRLINDIVEIIERESWAATYKQEIIKLKD